MNLLGVQTWVLRLFGLVGSIVFLTAFSFTFAVPDWVEARAADYIEQKAQERIGVAIDSLQPPEGEGALQTLARSLYDKNEHRIESLKENLKSRVNEKWAASIAAVRNLDCECRKQWENMFEDSLLSRINLFNVANERISTFIHSSYMSVVEDLKFDIRLFTGSNAFAFLVVLLLSFVKPRAVQLLFLPGMLLLVSTLICSYFYIFQQNWLLTIIQGSYLGYAYIAWLGAVFVFLSDIVFLHGAITSSIINAVMESIGSAFTVGPC